MSSTSNTARPAFARGGAVLALLLVTASIFSVARAQTFPPPPRPPQAVSPNDYAPIPQARPDSISSGSAAPEPKRASGLSNSTYLDALWQDEFNGNPESALREYQALVDRFDAQRKRAGEDLLKLGELEHAKGHSNAARACFGRLLREFVDFPQFTEPAREYLAVSGPEPDSPSETGGIGVVLSVEGNYPKIMQILPEGAVAKDGRLQVGDSIAGVGQEGSDITLTSHMKMEQIVALIRGPVGTTVRLLFVPTSAITGSVAGSSDDLSGARIVELRRTPLGISERPAQSGHANPFEIGSSAVGVQNGARENGEVLNLLKERVRLLEDQLELTKKQFDAGAARNADLDALRKKLDAMQQDLSNELDARRLLQAQPDVRRP